MKSPICQNCETPLPNEENFCPKCGQKNQTLQLSVNTLLGDFFNNIFNYDARIWKSLRLLLLKPGQLTLDFLEGKRKSYLSPVRLYLSISVIYFILLAVNLQNDVPLANQQIEQMLQDTTDAKRGFNMGVYTIHVSGKELQKWKENELPLDSFMVENDIPINTLNRLMTKQTVRMLTGEMGGVTNQFNQYASFSMFFLMPIFGLLLYWFFRKKRAFYVEHLVLSLHFHALVFFLFSLEEVTEWLTGWRLDENIPYTLISYVVLMLFFGLYIKNVYELRWRTAIGKTLLVLLLYIITIMFALMVIGFLSLLMF